MAGVVGDMAWLDRKPCATSQTYVICDRRFQINDSRLSKKPGIRDVGSGPSSTKIDDTHEERGVRIRLDPC